jgi:hypothetical protein
METSRIVSLVLVAVYAVTAWRSAGVGPFMTTIAICCVPLALIWYPEKIGAYTGWVGSMRTVNRKSPPSWLRFAGWLLLLAPAVVMVLRWLRG